MQNFSMNSLTTGDCAAAAARAATANLLFRIGYESVTISHSAGNRNIPVTRIGENCNAEQSEYGAMMESCTPPDIRDKAEIRVRVSRIRDLSTLSDKAIICIRHANLFMQGGDGIATADSDRPGSKRGEVLIESGARELIFDAVADVCDTSD